MSTRNWVHDEHTKLFEADGTIAIMVHGLTLLMSRIARNSAEVTIALESAVLPPERFPPRPHPLHPERDRESYAHHHQRAREASAINFKACFSSLTSILAPRSISARDRDAPKKAKSEQAARSSEAPSLPFSSESKNL